jgi:glycosyltransferase EpsD
MKRKVLFTATVDSHIKNFHLPYLKYFKDNGYEVHVATNGKGKIPHCDKKHTVSFERSPFRLNNIKARKQLKNIIDKEGYEIIHTHTPMGSVITRLGALKARKKYKTRVIYTAHGFHFYKGAPLQNWLLYYPVEKILARYTDTLITINKEDYKRAKKKFSTRVEYVPGVGVDEKKFNFKMTKKEKSELRKSLGLKDSDYVLIYVAELNKNKNQAMLIDVMSEIVKEKKDFHLLLAGIDNYKGRHKKQVAKLGLESNVHFLGFRKDVPRLFKISDLAVSTSKREGLPINIIEAIYAGLPCLISKNRGHRDIVGANRSANVKSYSTKKQLNLELIGNFKINRINKKNFTNSVHKFSMGSILVAMDKIYDLRSNNKSRCVFVHDFKFYKYKDIVLGPGQFGFNNLWKEKFLSLFDEVDVIARGSEIRYKKNIQKSNVRIDGKGVKYISTESLSSPSGLKSIKDVRRAINGVIRGADLVVVRLPSLQGIVACSLLRRSKQPYVVEVVGNSFESYWYYGGLAAKLMALPYHLLTRRYVKAAPNVIYVTKKYLQEVYPNINNNIFCSSVKIEDFSDIVLNKRLSKIEKYNTNYVYKLGLVGPYNVGYKGHREAIEAISLMNDSGIKVELRLLGSGSSKNLKTFAEKRAVANSVYFDEPRSAGKEMSAWLDRIDLLLVPSKTEGLPRIMLEGMARGLPIIATRTGDILNILNFNSTIDKRNIKQGLRNKILNLLLEKRSMSRQAVDNMNLARTFNYFTHLQIRNKFIEQVKKSKTPGAAL